MADGPALHTDRFRVPMGDTDAAQLIYFGAPLRWAERMVTGYLADAGVPTSQLLAENRGLSAVETSIRYRRPFRLDDPVRGELRVQRLSRRSITWRCDFYPGEQPDSAVDVVLTQVSVELADDAPIAVALPELLVKNLTDPTNGGRQS